jgi:hypothetical protein
MDHGLTVAATQQRAPQARIVKNRHDRGDGSGQILLSARNACMLWVLDVDGGNGQTHPDQRARTRAGQRGSSRNGRSRI